MSLYLSGSDLEVNFAPIPQCAPSRSDSSGDGSCVAEVDTWRQAWLLYYALVQWLVAVVALLVNDVKIVASQVRGMTRRFVLAAESAVLCVRDTSRICWLRVIDVVAGSMGAMVLLSFLVGSLSVHRSVMCDGFIMAMGLAVVCQFDDGDCASVGAGGTLIDVDEACAAVQPVGVSGDYTSEPSDVVLVGGVIQQEVNLLRLAQMTFEHAVDSATRATVVLWRQLQLIEQSVH